MESLPLLYTFRRCPYCIRARFALAFAKKNYIIREIVLRDKPKEMLKASPKGTIPVLILPDHTVIDESVDIMIWALERSDLPLDEDANLIKMNDGEFKACLNGYKWPEKNPEKTQLEHRIEGEKFLKILEEMLASQPYLGGDKLAFTDLVIMPFVRQFRLVDIEWFDHSPYPAVVKWENRITNLPLFESMMFKLPPWKPNDPIITRQFKSEVQHS